MKLHCLLQRLQPVTPLHRWLSLLFALERLWEQYPALILYFKCAAIYSVSGRWCCHLQPAGPTSLVDINTSLSLLVLLPLLRALNDFIKSTQLREVNMYDLNNAMELCR